MYKISKFQISGNPKTLTNIDFGNRNPISNVCGRIKKNKKIMLRKIP
jgi:hypothetical protein